MRYKKILENSTNCGVHVVFYSNYIYYIYSRAITLLTNSTLRLLDTFSIRCANGLAPCSNRRLECCNENRRTSRGRCGQSRS